jgi:hypothetical protein
MFDDIVKKQKIGIGGAGERSNLRISGTSDLCRSLSPGQVYQGTWEGILVGIKELLPATPRDMLTREIEVRLSSHSNGPSCLFSVLVAPDLEFSKTSKHCGKSAGEKPLIQASSALIFLSRLF